MSYGSIFVGVVERAVFFLLYWNLGECAFGIVNIYYFITSRV